jgi:hypothetical protein
MFRSRNLRRGLAVINSALETLAKNFSSEKTRARDTV